jgi:hypothetical protein
LRTLKLNFTKENELDRFAEQELLQIPIVIDDLHFELVTIQFQQVVRLLSLLAKVKTKLIVRA